MRSRVGTSNWQSLGWHFGIFSGILPCGQGSTNCNCTCTARQPPKLTVSPKFSLFTRYQTSCIPRYIHIWVPLRIKQASFSEEETKRSDFFQRNPEQHDKLVQYDLATATGIKFSHVIIVHMGSSTACVYLTRWVTPSRVSYILGHPQLVSHALGHSFVCLIYIGSLALGHSPACPTPWDHGSHVCPQFSSRVTWSPINSLKLYMMISTPSVSKSLQRYVSGAESCVLFRTPGSSFEQKQLTIFDNARPV